MFYEVMPKGKVDTLIYDYDGPLSPGQIVMVPLGRRAVPGIVVKKVAQPDFPTKKIIKILYAKPLPWHLMLAAKFMQDYYLATAGQVAALFLPEGVEKKRRKTEHMFGLNEASPAPCRKRICDESSQVLIRQPVLLNQAQKIALKGLQEAPGATKLLFGITGSGKTNIYLKLALDALESHKSVVVLVPEIALTSQLVWAFRELLGDVVILLHSRQTEAERHRNFEIILNSDKPMIVIGPRSALFAPLHDLGFIIVDEEHDGAYYQENSPKYSAIRIASYMAGELGCQVILGSATPTIADYYIARKKGALVPLLTKAKETAIRPEIRVIDLRNRADFRKNRYFCDALLTAIRTNLEKGRQTLIFHNRRGSAPLTICEHCGEELVCPNCYLPLTLHADSYELVCHTCGWHRAVPPSCPKCGANELLHKGFGTKLLENELGRLFPNARLQRFDADNRKAEGLDALYKKVRAGEVDILVGTQMLAKGLDLPRLATVGVVQADAGLALPDFAAEERTFQLLTQVIGRVGRGHLEQAEVFIQTFRPDHPVIRFALDENYQAFAEYLLARREKSNFPPYRHIMRLELSYKTERLALERARDLALKLRQDKRLLVSPPSPAFHERTARGYTWQIVVRARSRQALIRACDGLDKNVRVTLDPPGLL